MQGELTQSNMSLQEGGDNEVTISQKGAPGMKKCQESPAGTNSFVKISSTKVWLLEPGQPSIGPEKRDRIASTTVAILCCETDDFF